MEELRNAMTEEANRDEKRREFEKRRKKHYDEGLRMKASRNENEVDKSKVCRSPEENLTSVKRRRNPLKKWSDSKAENSGADSDSSSESAESTSNDGR